MKKLLIALAMVVGLTGCTTHTAFGPCVGALAYRDPNTEYKLSIWNTALAVVFVETIVVPVVVVVDNTYCPTGKKATP